MNRVVQLTFAARQDIEDIYDYTLGTWGRQQADLYIDGLRDRVMGLPDDEPSWRPMPEWRSSGFRVRFKHHMVFFVAEDASLTIARVLHERRDLLRHLIATDKQA